MKWTIGRKIGSGFALGLILLIGIGLLASSSIDKFITTSGQIEDSNRILIELYATMMNFLETDLMTRSFLLEGDKQAVSPLKGKKQEIMEGLRKLYTLMGNSEKSREKKERLNQIVLQRLTSLENEVELRKEKGHEAISPQFAKTEIAINELAIVIKEIEMEERFFLENRQMEANSTGQLAERLLLGSIMFSVVSMALIAFVVNKNISQPLIDISKVAQLISEGSLGGSGIREYTNRSDEVGVLSGAFIKMRLSLQQVAELADQISRGNLLVEFKPHSETDVLGNALARMVKNLQEMAELGDQISRGNLQIEVYPQSESDVLGNALSLMVKNLRNQVKEQIQFANQLATTTTQMAASVSQFATGSRETAAAISETTTTMEELRQTAQLSGQKAHIVSDSALKVVEISNQGRKAIEDNIDGVRQISERMSSIADSIVKLSEQSQVVGEIITSVNDLADQSNLLAVNAAVESTKAGEFGKGFAVVAQEIKSLAEQSKQATMQIRNILKDVQKATNTAVLAAEQGSKAVEKGAGQSVLAGQAISRLAAGINDASSAASQISVSVQQQIVGVDQVVQAMESIKTATSQNLEGIKQFESISKSLHDISLRLKSLVDSYKV